MEMKKAPTKQVFGIRDNSNLASSANAAKASAAMFDTLTNSFLQIADVATTSAINAEIRDSTLEGEMSGVEGSAKDEDGSFVGYEKDKEIFKWNVASNKAAKTSFESNVTARAGSSMKTLSKEVDGDMIAYKNVAGKYLDDSLINVSDEQQRQHITNSYAKSYNQYMANVATRSHKKEGAKHKLAWDDSREAFVQDVSVVSELLYVARDEYKKAQVDSDGQGLYDAQEKIDRYAQQLYDMQALRKSKGDGGVMYGTLSIDGVDADTDDDMFAGYQSATVQRFRTSESWEEKAQVRKDISEADISELNPIRKTELLKVLDEELAHENSMETAVYGKYQRELTILKANANSASRTDVINLWADQDSYTDEEFEEGQEVVKDGINTLWSEGFLTTPEKDKYLEMLRKGDTTEFDDPSVYANIFENLEDFTLDEINTSEYLTFQSKKELTKLWVDQNENEQWMKTPAYRESKQMIQDAYGFSQASLIPEKISPKRQRQRIEMSNMLSAYREQVRAKQTAGEPANHYEIASTLLAEARDNVWSSILNTTVVYENAKKTRSVIQNKAKAKGVTFEQSLADFEKLGGELRGAPKKTKKEEEK